MVFQPEKKKNIVVKINIDSYDATKLYKAITISGNYNYIKKVKRKKILPMETEWSSERYSGQINNVSVSKAKLISNIWTAN